ncbi:MAG: Rieske 2Fe-2S domain-containing protein [Okeania sp. SIO2G4]|nr:Rieske 2Fe-2S domain-containing protein [Okeania sp. SIO2H7]NEP72638.1 Rieske 2Fe-2S domain-containing protein [Okeania sp. SIO2G5]NEP93849.1 Rieske 2Fe-2S domain-containing protein [Okeania sp. SIO2F5]NEQ91286.1 Rieske 2Fe-2S domain-containing protein [Okeania sp. SIO2G4]
MMTKFSWTKQWYPVTPINYLDPSHPTPITLLGKRLVIWQDKQEKWIAMDDTCPHKLAQLSLGSIDKNGYLMCRHHGWCFDGTGKCTNIPMLSEEKALETACNSERSQVTIYPTQVLQDLLWVWPDNSYTAVEDSTLKQPAVMPEDQVDSSSIDWFMSEVPVGYTVSVESSFDPSHAQFLHEGIAGFSPERAIPIQRFKVFGEISAEDGFTLKHSGYNVFNKDMDATRKFIPPCFNTTIYEFSHGKSGLFILYFVPTKPGYCKHISKFIFDGVPQKRNLWFELLPKYLQTGLKHSSSYKLSNQDLSIMHSQTINESTENKTWQKSYFMPSLADVGIVTFRKWLDEFAGGKPEWQGITETPFLEFNDEQLYDRWHRHTKHCPSCRQSLILIDKIKDFCQNFTAVLAILALFLIAINLSVKIILLPVLLSILSLICSYKLDSIRQGFLTSIPKTGLPVVKLY